MDGIGGSLSGVWKDPGARGVNTESMGVDGEYGESRNFG